MAEQGLTGTISFAGRVERPIRQPLPQRMGGFGGVDGLAQYIRDHKVTHLVDATHPFAAQMSANAVAACALTETPLIALTRAPWQAGPGDQWTHVPDIPAAVAALNTPRQNVMLAVGRMHLAEFAPNPQHFYLLRLVDPAETLPLPDAFAIIDRGPFTLENDLALMREYAIQVVVSKNAGGTGARAKLDAARALNLPVIMIDRPALPQRQETHDIPTVIDWLAHSTNLGV